MKKILSPKFGLTAAVVVLVLFGLVISTHKTSTVRDWILIKTLAQTTSGPTSEPSELPETALISEAADIMLFGLATISMGGILYYLEYQYQLSYRLGLTQNEAVINKHMTKKRKGIINKLNSSKDKNNA